MPQTPPVGPRPPLEHRRVGGGADAAALLAVARVLAGGGRLLVVNTDPAAARAVARVARTAARLDGAGGLVWAPRGWMPGLLSNWRAAGRGLAAYAQYAGRVEASAAGRRGASPATRRAGRRYRELLPPTGGAGQPLPWRALPDLVIALGGEVGGGAARECVRMGVPLLAPFGPVRGLEGARAAARLALMASSLAPRHPAEVA